MESFGLPNVVENFVFTKESGTYVTTGTQSKRNEYNLVNNKLVHK